MTRETALVDLLPPDPADTDRLVRLEADDGVRMRRAMAESLPPARRRTGARIAVACSLAAVAVAAVALVATRDDAPEVALTTGGSAASPPAGLPSVELELMARDPFTGADAVARGADVMRARGLTRGVAGLDVKTVGGRLFVEVPRAESFTPSSALTAPTPVLAGWPRSRVVHSASTPLAALNWALAHVGRGGEPATWYVVAGRGVQGPYFSETDASASRGPRRTPIVFLPGGWMLVTETAIADAGRRGGVRNQYLVVRGAPVLTGADVASVRQTATPRGLTRLALGLGSRTSAVRGALGGADLLLAVNGRVWAAPRRVPADGRLLAGTRRGDPTDAAAVAPEIAGAPVSFTLVGERLESPPDQGTDGVAVPDYVRAAFRAGARVDPALVPPGAPRPARGTSLVDPATIGRVAVADGADGHVELWAGRGSYGLVVAIGFADVGGLSTQIGPLTAEGARLALSPDSPAVTGAQVAGAPDAIALIGRASPDVTRVRVAIAGGPVLADAVPTHGWWALATRVPRPVRGHAVRGQALQATAYDAGGNVVGTTRLP